MKQNVRVHSDSNIVTDATVEVRYTDENGDDQWVDISNAVNRIEWTPRVGDLSSVTLGLIPGTMTFSGYLSDETLEAFAEHLRASGYDVLAPSEQAAA